MDFLPYGRQSLDADDEAAVLRVLRSDWLTTGPEVDAFEGEFAEVVGAKHAVAVANGTAALHAAATVAGIGPGDEVLVPAITFVASANCVVYRGATPVIVDVDSETLLLDVAAAREAITPRTRAIIAVDYAGQPCDYESLRTLADEHGLVLIADACHALGATSGGRAVGKLADLTVFSFHPVKHVTTGEGGMITTDDDRLAQRLRRFRGHGIDTDHRARERAGSWEYQMVELGYNYRISDLACALGRSQLAKLPGFLAKRRELAATYEERFTGHRVRPLVTRDGVDHARHLFVVQLPESVDRGRVFATMRRQGIGVNVHYLPVHQHAFYREQYPRAARHGCPRAEAAYERLLSLPLFPGMTTSDVDRVVSALGIALRESAVAA